MRGVTKRALSGTEPDHSQVIAHHLNSGARSGNLQKQLEAEVEAPGLSDRGPSFAMQGGPRFRAQGEAEICRRKRPQKGRSAGRTAGL